MGPRTAVVALLCAAVSPAARAEEPGPRARARPVEEDLRTVRSLMQQEKWGTAVKLLREILDGGEGDPAVASHLPDIEEDLRACVFRAQEPDPSPEALFGTGASSWSPSSRRLVLSLPRGPGTAGWLPAAEGFLILPVRFDEVTVEYSGPLSSGFAALLCLDPDTGNSYVAALVPRDSREFSSILPYTLRLLRFEGTAEKELAKDLQYIRDVGSPPLLTVQRTPGKVTLGIEGKPRIAASEIRLKSGFLGVRCAAAGSLRVEGVVEKADARTHLGAYFDGRFREWMKSSWRREDHLPAWARGHRSRGRAATLLPLPFDAPDAPPAALLEALGHWSRGNRAAFLSGTSGIGDLPPLTRTFVRGLQSYALGRTAEAERLLSLLCEGDAPFHPALVYRGLTRLRVRNLEGARADLDAAREGAGDLQELWIGLASLSVANGDMEAAHGILEAARSRGVGGADLDAFAGWIHRSRRGPAWTDRFEYRGASGTVATDHSAALAKEVSRNLEATLRLARATFPGSVRAAVPFRVHVFTSRDGFLAHSAELGRDLRNAVGAYFPRVRELVLYVPPVSRVELWATLRHESFHAYAHDQVEEIPPWFDEGWGECFGAGEERMGGLSIPLPGKEQVALFFPDAKVWTPLRDLMQMDQETFLRSGGPRYMQSRALVQFMHSDPKLPFRGIQLAYFESLRAGLSPEEAFERHWLPVLPDLEGRFRSWLATGAQEEKR